ncbi:hypothetical protein QFC21_005616 [Naganishia friedmannii]|uniref:Uncharacterized protein n=1 Tax=Naganishia friedmannii TaxID=89922 RepID=A0ACC2V8L4_9TREE|nr:hypothetical protein QFC21_005616 [Naganishia friedmannii]
MSSNPRSHLQTPLDHSAAEDQEQTPPTIFTPRRRTGKALAQADLRIEEGQPRSVRLGDDRGGTPSSNSRHTDGQSRSVTNISATRRRPPIPTSHEASRMQDEPLQDERFERMLALLDDDSSAIIEFDTRHHHHSSTRNDESRGPGSAEGQSPRRASSFEALRQVVSATVSPNSRPRRRRVDHGTLQEQDTSAERARDASVDEADSDYRTARRDQQRRGGHATAQTRDLDQTLSSPAEQSVPSPRVSATTPHVAPHRGIDHSTTRSRHVSATLRYAMQPFPPSSSLNREPAPGTQLLSPQRGMHRYANQLEISPRRHPSQRRLSAMLSPDEGTAEPSRTRYSRNPGSSSDDDDDDDGRSGEDVLDTAPPSDLDARFPALSPQPSPLNSRRHHTQQVKHIAHTESAGSAVYRPEGFQPQNNGFMFAPDGEGRHDLNGLLLPEELREDNSRWNETEEFVNSFLHTRKAQRPNPTTLKEDQRLTANPETRSMSPDITPRHRPPSQRNGIAETYYSESAAVLQRIDTVTDQVHALRVQVAGLVTLISRLLGAGLDPCRNASDDAVHGAGFSHGHGIVAEEQETSRLPNPNQVKSLLLHLDGLVHNRGVPLDDDTVPRDDTPWANSDIFRVCETRNLDFIRERITDWEGVVRGKERQQPKRLARKGSQQ